MKRVMTVSSIWVLVVAFLFVPSAFAKDTYPERPISMVVWSTAGMGDTVTRTICQSVEKTLGQPVVIDTKPGAAGTIAINYALKQKPDGYTLCMTVTSNYIVTPHIRSLGYNVLTDIVDIATVCKYNFGLCVKADAPWKSYKDVVNYARKNPGKFKYACAGVGTIQHITMEMMAAQEKIKWTQVPFKSGGESVIACLGGHTDAVVQGSLDVLPQIKAGKLRMLLSVDGDKWPDVPNVPTMQEEGYDFAARSYITYMTRKGVPKPIIKKLEAAFQKATETDVFKQVLSQYNVPPGYMTGEAYEKYWKARYGKMGEELKKLGLIKK